MLQRIGIAIVASLTAALWAVSLASASQVVPPGNSAATQYTEAYPTAGGQADAGGAEPRGSHSPSRVLGPTTTHELDAQGAEGRATAETAAATAPAQPVPHDTGSATANNGSKARHGGTRSGGNKAVPAGHTNRPISPSGSSAVGQIVAQGTGTASSGKLGLFLPLAIVATIAWAVGYSVNRRKSRAA